MNRYSQCSPPQPTTHKQTKLQDGCARSAKYQLIFVHPVLSSDMMAVMGGVPSFYYCSSFAYKNVRIIMDVKTQASMSVIFKHY